MTPRGEDACRRRGINQNDLKKKMRPEIIKMIKEREGLGAVILNDTVDVFEKYFEERRARKL